MKFMSTIVFMMDLLDLWFSLIPSHLLFDSNSLTNYQFLPLSCYYNMLKKKQDKVYVVKCVATNNMKKQLKSYK